VIAVALASVPDSRSCRAVSLAAGWARRVLFFRAGLRSGRAPQMVARCRNQALTLGFGRLLRVLRVDEPGADVFGGLFVQFKGDQDVAVAPEYLGPDRRLPHGVLLCRCLRGAALALPAGDGGAWRAFACIHSVACSSSPAETGG